MAEKFPIYFGEPLANATAGYEQSRSARLNQIAHEWLQIMAGNIPSLSLAEWQALMDCTSSAAIADDNTLKLLWAAVADSGAQCDRFGVESAALAAKLRTLTPVQRYALREALERAWLACEAGEDAQAALRLAGAVEG